MYISNDKFPLKLYCLIGVFYMYMYVSDFAWFFQRHIQVLKHLITIKIYSCNKVEFCLNYFGKDLFGHIKCFPVKQFDNEWSKNYSVIIVYISLRVFLQQEDDFSSILWLGLTFNQESSIARKFYSYVV